MHQAMGSIRVMVLWAAGLGAAVQFSKLSLFLPELELLYPNTGSTLGLLVSVISLFGALFGLIAGALATKVGLRRFLIVGLVLGATVSLVQSYLLSLPIFLLSRVLEGASHLAIVVSAPTLIALNSTDRYRPIAMTLWGTFFGVAFALTGWFGIALVESYGLSTLFLLHGCYMASIALIVLFTIPNKPHLPRVGAVRRFGAPALQDPRPAPGTSNNHALTPTNLITTHKNAWTSASIAAPGAGWLFYTMTFVALLSILPSLMESEARAFTAAALPIASIISSLTIGIILLRYMSAVHVLIIGFIAAILFAVPLSWFPSEPLLCIALFSALGLVQGASFASIPQLNKTGSAQALANGTLAQAGNMGNLLGTPLLLAIVLAGGIGAMIAFVVICYVLAISVHLLLAKRRARSV